MITQNRFKYALAFSVVLLLSVSATSQKLFGSPDAVNIASATLNNNSMSNGANNVSLPIYNLNIGSINVPITLNYSTTGFKPFDEAGEVGLGWNLLAGGQIQAANLMSKFGGEYLASLDENYNTNNKHKIYSTLNFDEFNGDKHYFDSVKTLLTKTENRLARSSRFYIYNFGNNAGKMYYYNGKCNTIPYDNIIVKQLWTNTIARHNLIGFEITNETGNTYQFATENLYIDHSFDSAFSFFNKLSTTYLLSSIVSADKKDTVEFSYSRHFYSNDLDTNNFSLNQTEDNLLEVNLLSKIKSKNIEVNFYLGNDVTTNTSAGYVNDICRRDIKGCYPKLDSVIINTVNNGVILKKVKKIWFNYEFLGKGENFTNSWLKLKTVSEINNNNTDTSATTFQYFDEYTSNPNFSFNKKVIAVDKDGYLRKFVTNPSIEEKLLRKYSFPSSSIDTGSGLATLSGLKYGILKQITHPTGSIVKYEYENNMFEDGFYHSNGTDSVILQTTGSLIDSIDIETFTPQCIRFSYSSQNNYTGNNVLQCFNINSLNPNSGDATILYSGYYKHILRGDCILPTGKYRIYLAGKTVLGNSKLVVRYDKYPITKEYINTGLRLKQKQTIDNLSQNSYTTTYTYKTDNNFSSGTFFPTLNCQPALQQIHLFSLVTDNYTIVSIADINNINFVDSLFIRDTNITKTDTSMLGYTFLNNLFKKLDSIGYLPTSKFYYSKITENKIVGTDTIKTASYYKTDFPIPALFDERMYKQVAYIKQPNGSYTPQITKENNIAIDYGKNKFDYWQYPVNSAETIVNNNGTTINSNNTYFFNSNGRAISAMATTNSTSEKLYKTYKHLFEYDSTINVTAFKKNNLSNSVVEEQVWKKTATGDSILLGGSITVLDTILFKPKQEYSLEMAEPLTQLDNQTKDAKDKYNTLLSDSRYVLKATNIYDPTTGNLIEQQKANSLPECIIYGYNNSYPVAKVVGKSYTDAIAQSGINLSIINNPTVTDATVRNELDKLRTLTGVFVTSYTYIPLVGITSETNAQGKTIYYEYDQFNRLKLIKDKDGHILKTMEYKYQETQ